MTQKTTIHRIVVFYFAVHENKRTFAPAKRNNIVFYEKIIS